jgi:hypothetical protein
MDEEWGTKLSAKWREDLKGDMSSAAAVGVHLAVLAHHVKVPEHLMQREAFMRLVAYTRWVEAKLGYSVRMMVLTWELGTIVLATTCP